MSTRVKQAMELILALVIVGTTLAFGGVRPLAYSLMEVGLFLTLFLLLAKQVRKGKIVIPLPVWPVLFVLLVVLQLVPLPARIVMLLSPQRPIAPPIGGLWRDNLWTTLSVYPHDTLLILVRFLAYLSAFLVAACLFDSSKRKSVLLSVLVFLGCFEAAYGIAQYLTGWQKIFWYSKEYDLGEATGTYINRNHFAGLLELTFPFVMALAFYSFQRWSERRQAGGRRRSSGGEELTVGYVSLFYFFLLLIMIVALLFSRSRSGILTASFSIGFIALLGQLKTRRKLWALGIFLFLACVVGFGLWIGLNPVLARFDQGTGSLRLEGRIALWKDELRGIRDYPLLGSGLGTFALSFRRYQTTLPSAFVGHAHNDYLEFAAETGLFGVALLFLPILCLFVRMIISFLDDPRRYRRAVLLGCIGSALGMLLHSTTDFNLQIPANALIFAVALGIGYKAAWVERRAESQGSGHPAGESQPYRSSVRSDTGR